MKTIKIKELKVGDIFAYSLQLKEREAFIVTKIEDGIIRIRSRNTLDSNKLKISSHGEELVIWLRNDTDI